MKIYWHNGKKNIIAENVRLYRKKFKLTQKQLSEKLQMRGYEFDRLTIQRIEAGHRFVADYEVKALAEVLDVDINELFTQGHNNIT